MKRIVLSLLVLCAIKAYGQKELHGVFSNEAEGFKIVTFMVHESGHAYFHASVAGTIGEWSYNKSSSILTFECFDPGPKKDVTIKFAFDSKKRTYAFLGDATTERTDSSKTLHYITNAIPEQLVAAFKTYPEELAKERRRIQFREEQKRKREEKLAREKPEYERIRKSIADDPRVVISKEFYVRDDTPATRALKSALGDRGIEFPEEVLVYLLEELPPDNHWIRKQIFARPELTAGTIEHYYPKALDWGLHLNYGILANIAQHPNTPWKLVEDLATRTDMPGGAVGPAQEQVKYYADDVASGKLDASLEEFRHLHALALKLPKTGHTKRGNKIILALAKSSVTPTNILVEIARTDDQLVQRAIVSNTNAPLAAVFQLSTSDFPRVRTAVGRHPAIPVETLLVLSGDKEGSVRAAVAAHPSTPISKLIEMQSDEYFDVRRNLIRNHNTPTSVLEKLAADKYSIIKSEARSALRERQMQNKAIDSDKK